MTPTTAELLSTIARVAPPVLGRAFRPNACIAATRVLCSVLQRFGRPVRPVVVELLAFNPAFLERLEAEGWPASRAELERWGDTHGAWSVGIGRRDRPPEGPGHWPGHLVAVAEDRWLFDPTIGQAGRPARGLALPDVLMRRVPVSWPRSAGDECHYEVEGGSLVVYRPDPGAEDYRDAPDWQRVDRGRPVADRIVERVRRALGG